MAAARGAGRRSSSTRCASGRTRRTSRSPRRWRRRGGSAPAARFFTHMAHDLGHAATCARLPEGMALAYDGLTLDDRRKSRRAVGDVIFFPDDPRARPRGAGRSSPSATSTACTAATRRSSSASAARPASRAATPVVMTFDPHPPRIVRPDKAPPLLMTNAAAHRGAAQGRHRRRRLRPLHPRDVAVGAGARSSATCSPTGCTPAEVWVGGNFLFGRDRSGNFSLLRSLGLRYGFRAEKIDPVRYRDFVVSSTRVRRLITEGRVDEAGALLGHYHFVDGTVVAGAGRGPRDRLPDRQPRPPRTSCCRRTASTRRRSPSAGRVHRADHQHRRPADLRDGRRVDVETHLFGARRGPLRPRAAARVRAAAAGRAGLPGRGGAGRPDPRRLRRGAGALRSPFALDGGIACRLDTIARMSGTSQGFGEHGAFTVSVAGDSAPASRRSTS